MNIDEQTELPASLLIELSIMGDPFNEDPTLTLAKMHTIWKYIKNQMPRMWKEANETVREEHERIIRSKLPSDVKNLAKVGKDRFFIDVYNLMHKLIEAAGLPTMNDLDSRAFMRISEIVMDDMHDFISSTGYRE
jgi:hypothetical protein